MTLEEKDRAALTQSILLLADLFDLPIQSTSDLERAARRMRRRLEDAKSGIAEAIEHADFIVHRSEP